MDKDNPYKITSWYDYHCAYHLQPGSDTNCPWCEDEYQEYADWQKDQSESEDHE